MNRIERLRNLLQVNMEKGDGYNLYMKDLDTLAEHLERSATLKSEWITSDFRIREVLAKALGYPSIESTADHTAETLAVEAANELKVYKRAEELALQMGLTFRPKACINCPEYSFDVCICARAALKMARAEIEREKEGE